jgi:hypothetical protein
MIPQGISSIEIAKEGIYKLAEELLEDIKRIQEKEMNKKPWKVSISQLKVIRAKSILSRAV